MALNNVPQPNQTLNQTQNPILQNFNTIDTAFSVNHVAYQAADQGKHKFVQMPEQGVAPGTAANEAALYAAVGAISAVSELVFRREGNGEEIPFTEHLRAADGWTYLPSGIFIQWLTKDLLAADGSGTLVTFPVSFTAAPFNIQMTMFSAGDTQNFVNVVTGTVTLTNFRAKSYTRSGNRSDSHVYIVAIGY